METFFTFLDGALKYDCPTCGSQCCKGTGVALEAQAEVLQFARLEPRLAALLQPTSDRLMGLIEGLDGCWMLEPSGLCAIETSAGYDAKPSTCKLFPFNRIFSVEGVRVVDVNSRLCPLTDAVAARDGQSWAGLLQQLDAHDQSGLAMATGASVEPPRGGPQLRWLEHERFLRDASAAHLDAADYTMFAAFQEEAFLALARGTALPEPGSASVRARAELLRGLVERWRAHHGVEADPGLAAAARTAARQVTLLTTSWRLNVLLRPGAGSYGPEIQLLPKNLLASAHMIELGILARRRPPGLRAATEAFQTAAPLITLLALFGRRARLKAPIAFRATPLEVRPAVEALSAALGAGTQTLGDSARTALAAFSPAVRSLAFGALAYGDAQLSIE